MKIIQAVLLSMLLAGNAPAGEMQYVQTMHDTIPIYGTQSDTPVAAFDPAALNETVIVPAGATLDLSGAETAMDVLVRGTFRMLPGSSLNCRTLTAVQGGTIEIAEPATLTIRNLPIDLSIDPKQHGHGLVVVDGSLIIKGDDWRQSWATLAAEIQAGSATLTLTGPPHGWREGDRIVLPDTRQPTTGADLSAQTEVVTIASVEAELVMLTAPVQFAHLGWHKPDGSVGLLPDVGCITQPVVIQSENPAGTRGHVFFTRNADIEIDGLLVREIGRTTTAPLGPENQIGRYFHFHHCLGRVNNGKPYQFRIEHFAIDGSPKWGVSVHGSHFGIVNDGCVYNAAGCGIVTEDPWVYGNKITNNIVIAKQPGSNQRISSSDSHGGRSHPTDPAGDFWHNRGGFGLTSAMNEITGNRAYCCTESFGMAGAFGGGIVLYKPNERGVCPTCSVSNRTTLGDHMGYPPLNNPKRYPFVFPTSGNVAWSGWRGIESWFADSHQGREKMFPGFTAVHCAQPVEIWDHFETVFDGWRVLGDFSKVTTGAKPLSVAIHFKPDYRFGITFNDVEIRGYDAAYRHMNDSSYTNWNRCKFACPWILWMPVGYYAKNGACDNIFTECSFDKVNGRLTLVDGEFPKYSLGLWIGQVGRPDRQSLPPYRFFVRPWIDGFDYQLFSQDQKRTFAMGPPPAGKAWGDWPVGIANHEQLLALNPPRPIFGDVMPDDATKWSGWFWAKREDCCKTVQRLREEIEVLKGN